MLVISCVGTWYIRIQASSSIHLERYIITRDCGVTRSASTSCWEGDRFESRLNIASYPKTFKLVPTAAISALGHHINS